ncbi:MAG: hypothetical protein QXY59_04330 [Candidatus Korarchaeota archaeon]
MKSQFELNVIKSSFPLSQILNSIAPKCYILTLPRSIADVGLYTLPYKLYRYALENFLGFYIEKEPSVNASNIYLVSSDIEPLDNFKKQLEKDGIRPINVEILSTQDTIEFIQRNMHALLDSYLKLALRSYLQQIGYETVHMGNAILWREAGETKEDSHYLYRIDTDIDPITLLGYISVDVKIHEDKTLWEIISKKKLTYKEIYERYVNHPVVVPYRRGFAYGRIEGFIPKKISENIETKHGQLNLFEYYEIKKKNKS